MLMPANLTTVTNLPISEFSETTITKESWQDGPGTVDFVVVKLASRRVQFHLRVTEDRWLSSSPKEPPQNTVT